LPTRQLHLPGNFSTLPTWQLLTVPTRQLLTIPNPATLNFTYPATANLPGNFGLCLPGNFTLPTRQLYLPGNFRLAYPATSLCLPGNCTYPATSGLPTRQLHLPGNFRLCLPGNFTLPTRQLFNCTYPATSLCLPGNCAVATVTALQNSQVQFYINLPSNLGRAGVIPSPFSYRPTRQPRVVLPAGAPAHGGLRGGGGESGCSQPMWPPNGGPGEALARWAWSPPIGSDCIRSRLQCPPSSTLPMAAVEAGRFVSIQPS
jgi:hypothetical protein